MLHVSAEELQTNFDRHAFKCKHSLATHPLLQMSAMRKLAEQLPAYSYEFQSGQAPVNLPNPLHTPRTGLDILQTLDSLESISSWIALKNVEQDSEYQALLRKIIQNAVDSKVPDLQKSSQYEAFIFISSKQSITPYHMDPEHNFLLQIKGRKKVYVLDKSEKHLIPDIEIESFYQSGQRNRNMPAEVMKTAKVYELGPGEALYIPPTSPHWVEVLPGDSSLSFSATFRTPATQQRERNYRANAFFRGLGMNPSEVGTSAIKESIKYFSWVALRKFLKPGKHV